MAKRSVAFGGLHPVPDQTDLPAALQPPPHIVLVDDDALFLKAFAQNVQAAGYRVTCFSDPAAALAQLVTGEEPDACVFDWNMPGIDGMDLLNRVRDAGVTAPVMFLTSLDAPVFEELALGGGAVDFVEKTKSPSIILRRLALILGGAKQRDQLKVAPASEVFESGELTLKVEIKRALWRGHEVPLSVGEFDVVWLLGRRAGNDVPYREIYDLVRGDGFFAGQGDEGYRANVRAMIKRIRRKFLEIDPEFDALENYPGFGYRWSNGG